MTYRAQCFGHRHRRMAKHVVRRRAVLAAWTAILKAWEPLPLLKFPDYRDLPLVGPT